MSIFSYAKRHSVVTILIAVVVVIIAIIAGRAATAKKVVDNSANNLKQVTLVDVGILRTDASTVSADGVVESVSQVDLKSQLSGPLSAVNVALGQQVYAGEVIAEISNADVRAQLDQAETSLSLEDVSVDSARKSAIDTIRDSYQKGDDAVHSQIDQFILNTTGSTPQLSSFVTDSELYNSIRSTRMDLNNIFPVWQATVGALSASSTDAMIKNAISLSEQNISVVSGLLDNISTGVNEAAVIALPPNLTTLNAWKGIVSGARSSMTLAASNLTNTDKSFQSALATHGSAGNSTSVAASGVQNLQAQLAKTIITSPISGTVAALPLRVGELASPGQLIATIVGTGGLDIDAFASAEDVSRIQRGAKATIENNITGIVTSVSPSVNETNKKAELKISVNNSANSGLVVGENVSVAIAAAADPISNSTTTSGPVYRLPIQDVKITAGGDSVYTVDANSKIVNNPVTIGAIDGDFIEVVGGITGDMKIVSPVYELQEGDKVSVQ